MHHRYQDLIYTLVPCILVIVVAVWIAALPQNRSEEPAVPAIDNAPTRALTNTTTLSQTLLATGKPIVGITVFSPETTLAGKTMTISVLDEHGQRLRKARPLNYEYRESLLAIIADFKPIIVPEKTPLRLEITTHSSQPIPLFINEDNAYSNGQLQGEPHNQQTDLAFALRHPAPTSSATWQGILTGSIALIGCLLITRPSKYQWATTTLLTLIIIPLAIAGFWFSPSDWGQSDWDLYFPMHEVYRQTIRTYHTFPLWNPFTYGGVSAIGDPEFSVLTPLFIPQLLFGIPNGFRIALLLATTISGLGMLALSKRLGLSAPAAFLTAITFPLSSVVLLKFVEGHIQHLAVAWIPWIFWCWLNAYNTNKQWQGLSHKHYTNRWTILCGVALALTFYQGGIYILFYTIPALFIITALTRHRLAALATTLGAGMWSFGCAAMKVLPVMAWIREFPDEKFVSSSFSLPYWYELYLRPHLHGEKILPNQSGGWHEYGAYIGPIIFILVIVSLARLKNHRLTRILVIGTLLATLTASSGPLLEPLFDRIAWLPRSNVSRLALFSVFTSSLLAGFGLDHIRRHKSKWGKHLTPAITGLAAITIMSVSYPLSEQAFTIPAVVPPLTPAPSPLAFSNETNSLTIHGTEENRSYALALAGYGTVSYRPPLAPPLGIIPITEKGNDYLTATNNAQVHIEKWTPNTVRLSKTTTDQTTITLNNNFSRGWYVNGNHATNNQGRISTTVSGNEHTIEFTYRPPGFRAGVAITATTSILALFFWFRQNHKTHTAIQPASKKAPKHPDQQSRKPNQNVEKKTLLFGTVKTIKE